VPSEKRSKLELEVSLFDEKNPAEIRLLRVSDERLEICFNPIFAEARNGKKT
jgi:hypothetical protein